MAHNKNDRVQAGAASEHANIALFTPIAARILRSVDPSQVETIFKERDRYELEIVRKKAEFPSLRCLPYKASVYPALLKHFVSIGNFDEIAPHITVEGHSSGPIEEYL